MKKFLLSLFIVALSFGAEAQVVPLKIYNGMPFSIHVYSVAVRHLKCKDGTISTINVVIPPGGIYTVAPLIPGDPDFEWAGSKISDLMATSFVRAIHPYFEDCWLPSVSFGAVTMTGYWYPIGASPFQVLKIY